MGEPAQQELSQIRSEYSLSKEGGTGSEEN
jgi:hypothetical protein